jgi:hypothetical protein
MTPPTISFRAPSTIPDGSLVLLPDGTSTTVDVNGLISASAAFTATLLAAGFQLTSSSIGILMATGTYIKTASGVQTLLAAAESARTVIIVGTVTEVFANGDGAQPTFKVGETGSDAKFQATSKLTGAAAAATFVLAGTLSADVALIVTATAATGSTSTGAVTYVVIAIA